LKQELAKLRGQFNDKYPDVILLAREVATLEREVDDAKAREPKENEKEQPAGAQAAPPGRQPVTPYVLRLKEALSEAEADIKVFKGEERRLKEAIASYQARIENVPRREQEFRELARDYDSTRELYQSLLKRYEEAQLAESMEQRQKGEQFRVLDTAIPRLEPAAPNRVQLLVIAVLGSLGLAVGAVMLAERIDTSFHTVDELRTFSALPVLVSIPLIITRRDSRRRHWRMRLAASAACIALALIVGAAYFAAHGNERLVSLLVRNGGS